MFRANPAIHTFLGGVFVSMGLGFVSSVVTPSTFPERWIILLGAATLSVTSGLFWTVLGWRLDELQRIAIQKAPHWVDDEEVWMEFIRPRKARLMTYLVLALVCGIGSLLLLFITSEGVAASAGGG